MRGQWPSSAKYGDLELEGRDRLQSGGKVWPLRPLLWVPQNPNPESIGKALFTKDGCERELKDDIT